MPTPMEHGNVADSGQMMALGGGPKGAYSEGYGIGSDQTISSNPLVGLVDKAVDVMSSALGYETKEENLPDPADFPGMPGTMEVDREVDEIRHQQAAIMREERGHASRAGSEERSGYGQLVTPGAEAAANKETPGTSGSLGARSGLGMMETSPDTFRRVGDEEPGRGSAVDQTMGKEAHEEAYPEAAKIHADRMHEVSEGYDALEGGGDAGSADAAAHVSIFSSIADKFKSMVGMDSNTGSQNAGTAQDQIDMTREQLDAGAPHAHDRGDADAAHQNPANPDDIERRPAPPGTPLLEQRPADKTQIGVPAGAEANAERTNKMNLKESGQKGPAGALGSDVMSPGADGVETHNQPGVADFNKPNFFKEVEKRGLGDVLSTGMDNMTNSVKQSLANQGQGGEAAPNVTTAGEVSDTSMITRNVERADHLDDPQEKKIYDAEVYKTKLGHSRVHEDQTSEKEIDKEETAAVVLGKNKTYSGAVPHEKPRTPIGATPPAGDSSDGMYTSTVGTAKGAPLPSANASAVKDAGAAFVNDGKMYSAYGGDKAGGMVGMLRSWFVSSAGGDEPSGDAAPSEGGQPGIFSWRSQDMPDYKRHTTTKLPHQEQQDALANYDAEKVKAEYSAGGPKATVPNVPMEQLQETFQDGHGEVGAHTGAGGHGVPGERGRAISGREMKDAQRMKVVHDDKTNTQHIVGYVNDWKDVDSATNLPANENLNWVEQVGRGVRHMVQGPDEGEQPLPGNTPGDSLDPVKEDIKKKAGDLPENLVDTMGRTGEALAGAADHIATTVKDSVTGVFSGDSKDKEDTPDDAAHHAPITVNEPLPPATDALAPELAVDGVDSEYKDDHNREMAVQDKLVRDQVYEERPDTQGAWSRQEERNIERKLAGDNAYEGTLVGKLLEPFGLRDAKDPTTAINLANSYNDYKKEKESEGESFTPAQDAEDSVKDDPSKLPGPQAEADKTVADLDKGQRRGDRTPYIEEKLKGSDPAQAPESAKAAVQAFAEVQEQNPHGTNTVPEGFKGLTDRMKEEPSAEGQKSTGQEEKGMERGSVVERSTGQEEDVVAAKAATDDIRESNQDSGETLVGTVKGFMSRMFGGADADNTHAADADAARESAREAASADPNEFARVLSDEEKGDVAAKSRAALGVDSSAGANSDSAGAAAAHTAPTSIGEEGKQRVSELAEGAREVVEEAKGGLQEMADDVRVYVGEAMGGDKGLGGGRQNSVPVDMTVSTQEMAVQEAFSA